MSGKKTTNVLEILDRRHFRTRARKAELDESRASAGVPRCIYELRTKAGLTPL